MKPYNSNSHTDNCSPISSNCVIWQGPDLQCINLCKGDSVSDVIYKLATELCQIKEAIKLTDVDFDCLVDACQPGLDIPTDKKLENVIQLLTNAICCVAGVAYDTSSSLAEVIDREYTEPTLQLPQCLWYLDPATGILITSLLLSEYVPLVANRLCELIDQVNLQQLQITDLQVRVTNLENEPGYTPPQVVPSCTYGSVTQGIPTEIDILLVNSDQRICTLIQTLGDTPDLGLAANRQCELLSIQDALSQSGTMGSIPGWNNVVSNFAQSMQNLWLTVCDMRAAIYDLKSCCGSADCSAFFLVYQALRSQDGTTVTLIFNNGTVIPSGFVNCLGFSTISITDGNGHTYTDTLDLITESTNPLGVTYTVSGSGLNPNLPYTITVNGCIEKDGTTCSKQVVSVTSPATTTTTTTTTTSTSSTTTSTTSTTSTTTTTTCGPCYEWVVTPSAIDLGNASGNTTPGRDGRIFVSFTDCDGVPFEFSYTTTAGGQGLGCSCNVPFAYYYISDVLVPASGGTISLISVCGAGGNAVPA
jgi:hypothetical protein